MCSHVRRMVLLLMLVAIPATWGEAVEAASITGRAIIGPSMRIVVQRNGKEPGKHGPRSGSISPPPKGHDFTKIAPGARYVPGELLMRFAPRADGTQRSIAEKERIIRRLGGRILKHYRLIPGSVLVALPPGQTVKRALIIYNRAREILYAEPNYIRQIPELPEPKPAPRPIPPARKPSVLRPQSPGLRLHHSSRTRKGGSGLRLRIN